MGRGGCGMNSSTAAIIAIGRQQLAHFQLDQLEDFLVVDLVNLVHVHHQGGHADLTGKQDVLAGLRHWAVSGIHHQDGAVHLRRTGDHVLHIVSVARAVDVRVVAIGGLILNVGRRDGDATLALLRSLVDVGIVGERGAASLRQNLGDRGSQGRLAVVDVTDSADVAVRLGPLKLSLSHCSNLLFEMMITVRDGARQTHARKSGAAPNLIRWIRQASP